MEKSNFVWSSVMKLKVDTRKYLYLLADQYPDAQSIWPHNPNYSKSEDSMERIDLLRN